MTHELKIPLIGIRAASDILKDEIDGKGYTFEHDYVEDIKSYTSLMARLVTQARLLLTTSLSPITTSPERLSLLDEVINPAISQCRMFIENRGRLAAQIVTSGFDGLPFIFVDKSLLQQAAFSLLRNAISYGRGSDKQLRIEVNAKSRRSGIEVRFRDWGMGVSSPEKESIFERGYRARDAQLRDVSGHGIGLYLVRHIMRAHGGEVAVTSLNNPTEFTISLPSGLASAPYSAPSPQNSSDPKSSDEDGISYEVKLLSALETSKSSQIKGAALEELMTLLLLKVQGFTLHEKNLRTGTEEIDISIINGSPDPVWRREGALILVECKKWSSTCGKNELVLFKEKILNRRDRCTCGIFVAWNGYKATFKKELMRSSQSKALILMLDGKDVRDAVKSGSLEPALAKAWKLAATL